MRHIVETTAPYFEAISVKEVLKDMFGHARLRKSGRGLRHEFVNDAHAQIDQSLEQVLFQFLMQNEPFKD